MRGPYPTSDDERSSAFPYPYGITGRASTVRVETTPKSTSELFRERLHCAQLALAGILLCTGILSGCSSGWGPYAAPTPLYTASSGGYRVLGDGVKGIRSEFVVPQLAPNVDTGINEAIDVGSWQGDTQYNAQGLGMYVAEEVDASGTLQYGAGYGALGSCCTSIPLTISAGDHIQAAMEATGGSWNLTLTDLTTGQTWQGSYSGTIPNTCATFDVGPGPSSSSIATFSPITYSHPEVRFGAKWMDLTVLNYQATILTEGATPVAQPSVVTPDGFTVTRSG